jgi:hypothetical protein
MLPIVKKSLSSALTKFEKVKKVVLGVAAAVVLATGAVALPTEAQAAPSVQTSLTAGPVMLMATSMDDRIAWHSSHSSHASHASHASHYSSRY